MIATSSHSISLIDSSVSPRLSFSMFLPLPSNLTSLLYEFCFGCLIASEKTKKRKRNVQGGEESGWEVTGFRMTVNNTGNTSTRAKCSSLAFYLSRAGGLRGSRKKESGIDVVNIENKRVLEKKSISAHIPKQNQTNKKKTAFMVA